MVSFNSPGHELNVLGEHRLCPHSDLKPVIVQDEGSIDAGQLGGRHPEGYLSSKGAPTGIDQYCKRRELLEPATGIRQAVALTAGGSLGSNLLKPIQPSMGRDRCVRT
jgi:hypothetical protein